MVKYFPMAKYIGKPFLIYDFATAPLWISLYMGKKLIFFFISVYNPDIQMYVFSIYSSAGVLKAKKYMMAWG
jgi:hypothetical protein